MKYLLIGHGSLAISVKKTVEFLIGQRDDLVAIDVNDESLACQMIRDFTDQWTDEGLVVFVDMAGSPVWTCCKELHFEKQFQLVCGYNIAMLLEILLAEKLSDDQLCELVEDIRGELIYVNDLIPPEYK